MKTANLVAILFLASTPAIAGDAVVKLHLECKAPAKDCVKMTLPDKPEETFMARKRPAMVLGPADVQSAQKTSDTQDNQDYLALHLSEAAGKKFAKLTKANVRKRLAIVVGEEVLTAPVIQTEIAGGRVQLTSGLGHGFGYLDQIPWLKKMSEAPAEDAKKPE